MKTIKLANLTLFQKMFILLFLSVSVPVTILGYLYFSESKDQIEHITKALLMENLQQNSQRIEQFFKEAELHSESIIGSQRLEILADELEKKPLEDRLFLSRSITLTNELKGRYDLSMYPPDEARYVTFTSLIRTEAKPAGTEWISKALELKGKGFWYFDNNTFIYARLVRAMSDLRPLAVIKLTIPSAALQEQLLSPANYSNFGHYIVDRETDKVLLANSVNILYREKNVFAADIALADSPWKLVAAIPEADLIGPVEKIRQFSFVLVFISICLIAMLLALITNSFINPIKYILGQMKKVQLGTLVPGYRYDGRRDEIGQLAKGYNSLIFGMQELLDTTKLMESEKSRMEMQMLIHQINPHFLYNTLDAIKWRADHVKEQTITEMVSSLGNLIRYSINNGEEFTTVEREIEHVKSYLRIEALRNQDAFQVVVNVKPRLLNYPILKLIIQPLVENSVRHGLNKLQPGQGKILVRIFMDGEDLVCTVEDNGPGFPEEAAAATGCFTVKPDQTGGVGLYNVNQRLKNRFGFKYGVVLANREQGGCKATIRHPVMEPQTNP
ncbi:cache domain-containing sensor histidine kinase [Paenibacillus piri]|uniref:Sensor histidine kinase n=1 Tax=Paenibacillus piri TaxID=2547395 RepID=A0A4R5L0C0_9BACL|nr:histidine kinase [Paenibacillus piri]TDG00791.1 sensor histidine kinase [Paenibacillus piri]